jgi:hypothetical protein
LLCILLLIRVANDRQNIFSRDASMLTATDHASKIDSDFPCEATNRRPGSDHIVVIDL